MFPPWFRKGLEEFKKYQGKTLPPAHIFTIHIRCCLLTWLIFMLHSCRKYFQKLLFIRTKFGTINHHSDPPLYHCLDFYPSYPYGPAHPFDNHDRRSRSWSYSWWLKYQNDWQTLATGDATGLFIFSGCLWMLSRENLSRDRFEGGNLM